MRTLYQAAVDRADSAGRRSLGGEYGWRAVTFGDGRCGGLLGSDGVPGSHRADTAGAVPRGYGDGLR